MATRFYLPSTGAAAVSPTPDTGWEVTTGFDRIAAVTTKITSAMTNKSIPTTSTVNGDVLARQYVSAAISAQTISGTVKAQMRALKNTADPLNDAMGMRVVSNDGTTVTGTFLAVASYKATAMNTALRNKTYADGDTITSVTANANDRIVIELGGREPSGDVVGGQINFGDDSGTDLAEDETTTTANNPWVEFSATITFATSGPPTGFASWAAYSINKPPTHYYKKRLLRY